MLQSFTIVEIILTLFAKFGRLRRMKSKPYQRKTFEVFLYHFFSNGVGSYSPQYSCGLRLFDCIVFFSSGIKLLVNLWRIMLSKD